MAGLGINVGVAYIPVLPDMRQFQRAAAAGVTRAASGLNNRLRSVGSSLTRYVTLPLVAAGAESVKMAATFDTTFARITVLAGKLGVPLEQAKKQVLALAAATGQDPNSLANSLYFVASAGLKVSQVFPVLKTSAQAAMVGMGNLEDISKLLVGVLNAYRGQGLSAAKATDTLAAAIKVGAAEPNDMVRSMGTVVTVAAQMKVSFAELTSAIATATDVGVPAARAITGLRYVLQNMQAPTEKSQGVLKDYGLTVKDLQDSIEKRGLIITLQSLAKTFNLNTVAGKAAWNAVIGGARGLVVANTLVGNTAGLALRNLKEVTGSTDTFTKAVAKLNASPLVKFQKALSTLKVAAIEAGNIILPFAIEMVNDVKKLAEGFALLPRAVQGTVIKLAVFAAALGPVIRLIALFRVDKLVVWLATLVAGLFKSTAAETENAVASEAMAGANVTATASLEALAVAADAAAASLGLLAGAEGAAAEGSTLYIANAAGQVVATQSVAAASAEAAVATEGMEASTIAAGSALAGMAGPLAVGAGLLLGLGAAYIYARKQAEKFQPQIDKAALLGNVDLPGGRAVQNSMRGRTLVNAPGQTDAAERAAAVKKLSDLQYQLYVQLNKTSAGYKTFQEVIKGANNITLKQGETIASTVSALANMGTGLSDIQKQQAHNLLLNGDFAGAMRVLNEQFKVTPDRVFNLIDAMNRAKVGITVAEQKQLSAAIASGDWAKALKILEKRLDETHTKLGPVAKKFFDLEDAVKNAGVKIKGATQDEIQAAIKAKDWRLALKLLNDYLEANNKKVSSGHEARTQAAKDAQEQRNKSHGLALAYDNESSKMQHLLDVLHQAGKKLTDHQHQQLQVAVAAGDWAQALKIIQNRLKDTNVDIAKANKQLSQNAKAHAEARVKVQGLNASYGKTVDVLKDTTKKTKDLTSATKDVPTNKTIYYQTPGLGAAISGTATLDALLSRLGGTHNINFQLHGFPGKIPVTAQGGIIMNQQVRSLAEHGPEAVIPLSRLDEFVGSSKGRSSARGRGKVTLVVGGREFDAYMEEQMNPLTEGKPFGQRG